MGDSEFGKCGVCGKEKQLTRTYFYYNIQCECHSPQHFEMVAHCRDCVPKEPKETRVVYATEKLRHNK